MAILWTSRSLVVYLSVTASNGPWQVGTPHNPRTRDHGLWSVGYGFSLINFTGRPPQVSPQPLASGLRYMVGVAFWKTSSCISGAFPRNVTVVRLLQLKKAPPQILVTPSGIVISIRLVHLAKVDIPMLVTFSPMVMLFN